MSSSYDIEVTISPRLWERLSPGRVKGALQRGLQNSAPYIDQAAQSKAHFVMGYETGKLRSSITHRTESYNTIVFVAPATNTVGKPYGQYVEFGTGRGPAQPFLVPAVKESLGLVKDNIMKELRG